MGNSGISLPGAGMSDLDLSKSAANRAGQCLVVFIVFEVPACCLAFKYEN